MALQQVLAPRRWPMAVAAVVVLLAAVVAIGEWMAWPFLAGPLERELSSSLDRRVRLSAPADAAQPAPSFGIRFLGGVHLQTSQIDIAAPAWSSAPHMLMARDVDLWLRYIDLWRAWRGEPLHIERLQASALDGQVERLADGRASWQLRPADVSVDTSAAPWRMPSFGLLHVDEGALRYRDGLLDVDVESRMTLADGLLKTTASGRYRALPVKVIATVSDLSVPTAAGLPTLSVPITVDATIGRARLRLDGRTEDALRSGGFSGRFELSGPSLAAVGDPVGVTLPTTAAFHSLGVVVRQGGDWRVRIDDATVGASRLNGAFSYLTGGAVPVLAGRLGGSRLALVDLGPVVGTTPITSTADPSVPVPSAPTALVKAPGKVLPARPFDLAALRVMDADVLIDIAEVDLNTMALEPLRPLRAHLQLAAGVLTLSDLDARTADGRLSGRVGLDGRGTQALWDADLRWNDVRLERWVRQARSGDAPPYVSGRLNGRATLQGQGRSTADILASLNGRVHTELTGGAVSHLVVEAAGIDVAQALGVLLKKDDPLPLGCAVADLDVAAGALRPRVMVIDTTDSAVWVDGSLSLAAESLDLRAVVSPKDFSPLTLRAPVHVRGSFADPEVSLDKAKLGGKVAASVLLALLNPLAALIPLIDTGDSDTAQRNAAACRNLMQRGARKS
jgi:uncharacterized protein involved in outer membrane biogenesis